MQQSSTSDLSETAVASLPSSVPVSSTIIYFVVLKVSWHLCSDQDLKSELERGFRNGWMPSLKCNRKNTEPVKPFFLTTTNIPLPPPNLLTSTETHTLLSLLSTTLHTLPLSRLLSNPHSANIYTQYLVSERNLKPLYYMKFTATKNEES